MFFSAIHKRFRIIFLIFIMILLAVFIKIFYTQVISYNKLKNLSDDLYSINLPLSSDRGLILDRNGKTLAGNITTTSLVLIPKQIKNKEEVSQNLADIIGISYDEMYSHVNKSVSIERVHPEGRNLSYDIAEKIENLNYEGVYLVRESKRYYPYGNVLSHTLGYVGIDNQGLSGLELQYEDYLKGKDGYIKYYNDGKGNPLEKEQYYVSPSSGINISLTIDIDIQLAAENELNNIMSKYDAENALILVMDPNNGEILAMASKPDFNPNEYQNASTEVLNRNLPIWKTYEPGSTFKIITLASAIEENVVNIFEDTYTDSGSINVDGTTLHCWKTGGHGSQTYLEVVENSCNTGFVTLGLKLGKEKLMKYIKDFGFGEKTGIDLNGEASGILFKTANMGNVETAVTAFGQGISVTPIQQVTAVSAAINGGTLYTPYIVKNFINPYTNSILSSVNPVAKRKVISEETSETVRYALESVVANGTGRNAYIENYRVGGKTGTAQKVYNGAYLKGNYILSFIGFLPADNPQAVVYVAIDNPKNVTQYGGTASAPVARNMMLSIIEALDIKESDEGMMKEYTYLDVHYIKVSNVVGKTLEETQKLLKDFKISYSGTGDKVIYQSPSENKYLKEGSTVKVVLG